MDSPGAPLPEIAIEVNSKKLIKDLDVWFYDMRELLVGALTNVTQIDVTSDPADRTRALKVETLEKDLNGFWARLLLASKNLNEVMCSFVACRRIDEAMFSRPEHSRQVAWFVRVSALARELDEQKHHCLEVQRALHTMVTLDKELHAIRAESAKLAADPQQMFKKYLATVAGHLTDQAPAPAALHSLEHATALHREAKEGVVRHSVALRGGKPTYIDNRDVGGTL